MKKYSCCLFVFLVASCSQHQIVEIEEEIRNIERITMITEDFSMESATRTILMPSDNGIEFTWAENDTVGIYPERGDQVGFPMSAGMGTNTAYFDGGAWALKASSKYAAYYPFNRENYNRNSTSLFLKYVGQKQTGDASTTHLGAYDYMAANAVTPTDGQVTFAFKHLNSLLQFKLSVPDAVSLQALTLTTDDNLFASGCTLNLQTEETTISAYALHNSITLDLENVVTSAPNQTITLYLMIAPTDLTGKTMKANLLDTEGNSYAATIQGKNYERGKAYAFTGNTEISEAVTMANLSIAGTLMSVIGSNNINNVRKLKIIGDVN